MVSPNSQLYKTHPDWILHVPGRKPSLGRNQLILDLSRSEVQDYILGALDDILSCGDIDYVKWDMNRNMTEVGSAALPPELQGETAHRYISDYIVCLAASLRNIRRFYLKIAPLAAIGLISVCCLLCPKAGCLICVTRLGVFR